MGLYYDKRTKAYYYQFMLKGHRFYGPTGKKSRREAEAVERLVRDEKQRELKSLPSPVSLAFEHLTARYWDEVGQHHSGADNTFRDLARLVDYFGKDKHLDEIIGADVGRLVAWRRSHRAMPANKKEANPEDYPLISNATVNRSTIEVLKKLFTFAKRAGARFDQEPDWKRFMLEEAEERVRELNGDEGERIETAIDDHYADYAPYFAFLHASGLRRNECLLRWLEIDWEKGEISLKGKGKRTVRCMITPTIRAILSPLRDHHPEWVFTYSAQRTRDGRVAGRRYPLTMNGVKTAWKRLRAKSGVVDFRLHDFRHDLGTKLLRKTGNLKLVSKVLNHRDLKTTMRYAHVLDADVTEALESVTRRDVKLRKKLRNKPAVGG